MTNVTQLVEVWSSRSAPICNPQFSGESRQRVASLFIELADATGDIGPGLDIADSDMDTHATELARLAQSDALSQAATYSELRHCQLSLFDQRFLEDTETSVEENRLESSNFHLSTLIAPMARIDKLISDSLAKMAQTSPCERKEAAPVRSRKSLQHEIRTPLQGALLTSELVLEDIGHGEPVSADDIRSIRKSIEAAVQILNHFSGSHRQE